MRHKLFCCLLVLSLALPGWAQPWGRSNREKERPFPPPWTRRPLIQVVLILDTSPMMSGVIEQARADLYSVVNELLFHTKDGRTPVVQMAVLTAADGSVRVLSPFTTYFDGLFSQLEQVRTGHGSTRTDKVLITALQRLEWSPFFEDTKAIVYVGQGPVQRTKEGFLQRGILAAEKGILIHTFYAGAYKIGIQNGWAELAYASGGQYATIDRGYRPDRTHTSVDNDLLSLKDDLIDTYRLEADSHRRLWRQEQDRDREASLVSKETALERIVTKSLQGHYLNLTQSLQSESTGVFGLQRDIPIRSLPELETERELTDFQEQQQQRQALFAEVVRLAKVRRVLLHQQRASKHVSLGSAVIEVLQSQLRDKGFVIDH